MNLKEWAIQTAKITNPRMNQTLVRMVLVCAIKTLLEEFESDKENAELYLFGLGRFYLNRRRNPKYGKPSPMPIRNEYYWEIHFQPSAVLKACINGRRDYATMPILQDRLFTDEKVNTGYRVVTNHCKKIPTTNFSRYYRGKENIEVKEMLRKEGITYRELSEVLGIKENSLFVRLYTPLTPKYYKKIMKAVEVIKHERQQRIWR